MGITFSVKKLLSKDSPGVVRLTKVGRTKVGVEPGDSVRISSGKQEIVCSVHQGLKADKNELICRISKRSREALNVDVGGSVEIEKSIGKYKKSDKEKTVKKFKTFEKKTVGIKKGTPEICVLVIDCSESMRGRKFQDAKEAVSNFLDVKGNILEGDFVGCAGFDARAYEIFSLTSEYAKAKTKIDNLNLNLGTDIGVALDFARNMIGNFYKKEAKGKSHFAKHIILTADGNGNPNTPRPAAQASKAAGIIVDVVGIVDAKGSLQEDMLRDIAGITGGKYYSVDAKGGGPGRLNLQTVFRRRGAKEDL
jgi:Mg-chelatase subunit ChlD